MSTRPEARIPLDTTQPRKANLPWDVASPRLSVGSTIEQSMGIDIPAACTPVPHLSGRKRKRLEIQNRDEKMMQLSVDESG